MLQEQEIRRRLSSVQLAVGQAAQALSAERNLPGELRDYIQRLDRQSDSIVEVLALRDPTRIVKLIDDMEMLGARARRVCASGLPLTPQMKAAVNHMHNELADFKSHLH